MKPILYDSTINKARAVAHSRTQCFKGHDYLDVTGEHSSKCNSLTLEILQVFFPSLNKIPINTNRD